jgi:hypothetical protein
MFPLPYLGLRFFPCSAGGGTADGLLLGVRPAKGPWWGALGGGKVTPDSDFSSECMCIDIVPSCSCHPLPSRLVYHPSQHPRALGCLGPHLTDKDVVVVGRAQSPSHTHTYTHADRPPHVARDPRTWHVDVGTVALAFAPR